MMAAFVQPSVTCGLSMTSFVKRTAHVPFVTRRRPASARHAKSLRCCAAASVPPPADDESVTLESVKELLSSPEKGMQQKGLLYVRRFEPSDAFDLLLHTVKTTKNDFIRASATIALGQINCNSNVNILPRVIATLCDLLAAADDYGVRSAAAAALGYVTVPDGDPATTGALVEALNRALLEDSEWQVHFSCLAALGSVQDKRAIPLLLRYLDNDNDLIVQAAIGALGDIGDSSVVPRLLDQLGSTDMMTRQRLAHALSEMGNPEPGPAVIDALRTLSGDQSFAVREAAIEGLRDFGIEEPLKATEQSAEDLLDIEVANLLEGNESGKAEESASAALRRRLERSFDMEFIDEYAVSAHPPSTLRGDPQRLQKYYAKLMEVSAMPGAEELTMPDGEGLKQYHQLVQDLKHGSPSEQTLAAIQLRKFDGRLAFEALQNAAALDPRTASDRVRSLCVGLLARAGAVEHILTMLQNDPEQNVRSACCDALVDVDGGMRVVKACVRAFRTDEHWLVRISAAISLGTIGKGVPEAEVALIESLRPGGVHDLEPPQDTVVRRHAVSALGFLGSQDAVKAFAEYLQGGKVDLDVRRRIAAALGSINSTASVELVRTMIEDDDAEVSRLAQSSYDALSQHSGS